MNDSTLGQTVVQNEVCSRLEEVQTRVALEPIQCASSVAWYVLVVDECERRRVERKTLVTVSWS